MCGEPAVWLSLLSLVSPSSSRVVLVVVVVALRQGHRTTARSVNGLAVAAVLAGVVLVLP